MWALLRLARFRELRVQTLTTIGRDIAKSIFHVHGVDAARQAVIHLLSHYTLLLLPSRE